MTSPTDVAGLLHALEAMPGDLQAAAGKMSEGAARTPPLCGIRYSWSILIASVFRPLIC